jgi:hypothetical protein
MSTAIVAEHILPAEDGFVQYKAETDMIQQLSGFTFKAEEVPEHQAVPTEPGNSERNDPPETTLMFKIPADKWLAAKAAPPGSPESFWTHALYHGPAEDGFDLGPKVKVHYCRTKETTEKCLQEHFLGKEVLGFDIEWKSDAKKTAGPKNNVSLIQIACEDRIGLFHIALYPQDAIEDLVAPSLKSIMEDPNVTKVGVAIKGDCTRLRNNLGIYSRGIFELSHLYKLVKYFSSKDSDLINRQLVSLAIQAEEHLHLPLFKGEVRSSDWSQRLSYEQITYAASDSYAGFQIFNVLEKKRMALVPTPPRPYHAEEDKPIRLSEWTGIASDEGLGLEPQPSARIAREWTLIRPSFRDVDVKMDRLDPDFSVSISSLLTTLPTTRSKPCGSSAPAKSPLVTAASSLVEEYKNSHPKCKATPSSLRCYFLWYHNADLSLPDIAALLRETPLQTTTVVNYILEAIKAEKLVFEMDRLREVLGTLPKDVVASRYRALSRAVNGGHSKG